MKKIMKNLLLVSLVAFTMVTQGVSPAIAAPLVEIETVSIGAPGNAADTTEQWDNTNGYGAVSYEYEIGKYEVTVAQYLIFLNAVDPTGANELGLYNSYMDPKNGKNYSCGIVLDEEATEGSKYRAVSAAHAEKPVNYVSFWDAARFCNWLTNGATAGADTETGVYTLGGAIIPTNNTVTRNADAWAAGGWALPSEDEWYKAAYYNVSESKYTAYATGDSISTSQANYDWSYDDDNGGYFAPAGHYGAEQNGTHDIMGNVWEWNEAIISGSKRGWRGGSFSDDSTDFASSARFYGSPTAEDGYTGFRVSSLAVPEPGTYGVMAGAAALLGAIALRRRSRRH